MSRNATGLLRAEDGDGPRGASVIGYGYETCADPDEDADVAEEVGAEEAG